MLFVLVVEEGGEVGFEFVNIVEFWCIKHFGFELFSGGLFGDLVFGFDGDNIFFDGGCDILFGFK